MHWYQHLHMQELYTLFHTKTSTISFELAQLHLGQHRLPALVLLHKDICRRSLITFPVTSSNFLASIVGAAGRVSRRPWAWTCRAPAAPSPASSFPRESWRWQIWRRTPEFHSGKKAGRDWRVGECSQLLIGCRVRLCSIQS